MEKFDYLIVGAGFSGSVLAQKLNSINKKVLVIDQRNHIGGNCYDYFDQYNVLVHKYGPHYFRTNDEEVKKYLSKFTEWIPHEYIVKAYVNGKLHDLPINRNTLNSFFNLDLKTEEEAQKFLDSKKEKIENPKNAEEQILALTGIEIYKAFFKNYTKKQWDIDPKNLSASVTARIPIRTNADPRYFTTDFQAMPKDGYTKMFENILKGIKVLLNTSFSDIKNSVEYDKLIYTGSIDAFFNFQFDKLPYRSLEFIFENHDKEFYQKYSQINYPNDFEYTRIVEIKHATGQICPSTTIVKEIPRDQSNSDPFYPIPNSKNEKLYLKYHNLADKLKNVYFIGRLAQYKYINMDQVIKNALKLFEEIKNEK